MAAVAVAETMTVGNPTCTVKLAGHDAFFCSQQDFFFCQLFLLPFTIPVAIHHHCVLFVTFLNF